MTNDYMFHAVLQRNEVVLRGFLASLLGMKPEETTFYSRNVFMVRRTYRIFSSQIQLNVLSLWKANHATKADRACKLDYWAKLFRAATWEELRRLAGRNEVFNEMVVTMAELTADEKIRMQCEAREIYNKRERTWQSVVAEEKAHTLAQKARADRAQAQIIDLSAENSNLASENTTLKEQAEADQAKIAEMQKEIDRLRSARDPVE